MYKRGPPKGGRILVTSDALCSQQDHPVSSIQEVSPEDVPGCGEGVHVSKRVYVY